VFRARYALSPYIKQIRFVFKGLNSTMSCKGTRHNDTLPVHVCLAFYVPLAQQSTSRFREGHSGYSLWICFMELRQTTLLLGRVSGRNTTQGCQPLNREFSLELWNFVFRRGLYCWLLLLTHAHTQLPSCKQQVSQTKHGRILSHNENNCLPGLMWHAFSASSLL
jgi:hypothetical protein